MLSLEQKRKKVAKAYPGPNWYRKVMYYMPERQVSAIYESLKNRKKPKEKKRKTYHQISIEEWMESNER